MAPLAPVTTRGLPLLLSFPSVIPKGNLLFVVRKSHKVIQIKHLSANRKRPFSVEDSSESGWKIDQFLNGMSK